MRKVLSLLMMLLFLGVTQMWGDNLTKTEGFETKAASTSYNSTVTVSEEESDCGIGWSIYYGTVSTNDKISGSQSAQMRYYSNKDDRGYVQSTTAVEGLSNVAFKARVSSLDMKLTVSYSEDGSAWTALAENVAFTATGAAGVQNLNYDIPSGGKYIKFEVAEGSTQPTSSNIKLIIDDVVFTYAAADPDPDPEPDPDPQTQMKTIYCKMAYEWWTVDNAAIAAYAWTEGGAENAAFPGVRMTAVENEDNMWKIDLDLALYEKVIFTRTSASGDVANWGAQTEDLVIPTNDNNLFTISTATSCWTGLECKVEGAWSVYGEGGGEDPEPQPTYTYTVAGSSAALFGESWAPAKAENDMIKQEDGTYKWEKSEVELGAGDVEFKVVIDHDWTNGSYPEQNHILNIAEDGIYTVTITYNPADNNAVNAVATKTGDVEPVQPVDPEQMYVWNGVGVTSAEDAIELGGAAEAIQSTGTNIAVGVSQKGNWCLKANKGFSSGAYYLGIALDNAVNAGDTIKVAYFRTTENNSFVLGMDFSADKASVATTYQILSQGDPQVLASNGTPVDSMFIVPEGVANAKYIRLYRNSGGTGMWVAKFEIVAKKSGETPEPEPEPEPQMKTIYCKAPSWWLADGAAVAVFTWNDNGDPKVTWPGERMTLVENETDVYSFELDMNTYHMCIFTRVNGEGEIEAWGAKTGDLTIPTDDNDLFTITNAEGCWDSEECACTGAWSVYGEGGGEDPDPEDPEEVVLPVVKLAGSLTSWEEPVVMVNAEDSLSASLTLNLGIDHYQLKVVSDGNWLSKAGDNGMYEMHRDWNHVDHLDLINSGDNIKLITDVAGEYTFTWTYADSTLVVTFPENGGGEDPEPEPQMKTIYCQAPAWWLADGAAIGVFTWNDNGDPKVAWPGERMALVENETDVYSFELDMNTYHMCIFTRVNGEGEIEGWGAKTGDLTIPTDDNDLFTITNAEGCWESDECVCEGTWSKYEPSEPQPQPIEGWAEIVWTEVVAGADLAEEVTFNLLGSDFSATIHDAGDKMSIDENSSRFGTAEGYKMYTHRLKSGGASSSTKNYITLNIPSAGKLRIAARTGSNSATDRALVITQGEDELYNAIVQESQAVEVDEGEPAYQVNVYPYVTVDVAAGEVRVSYTAGMNFYGFAFEASAEPEPEPEPENHTYTVAGNLASVFGVAWNPAHEANNMIKQLDGTYKWEKPELELAQGTSIQFKVVKDQNWDNGSWPLGDNYTIEVAEDGIYTLAITFNPDTKEVAADTTKTADAEIIEPDPVFYIVGSMTDWQAEMVEMTATEVEGTYHVSIALDAESTYYFKVIKAVGENLNWYGAGQPVTMVYGNSTDWELIGDANIGLQTTKAGNYEFIFVNSDPMLISVVIPEPDPEQPVDSTTLYFVNKPAWETVMAYVWNNETLENFGMWPGNEMTLTETVFNEMTVYSFTFPTTFEKIIFNNGDDGEGNQTSDMIWNETTPYFYDGIWYASLEDINPEAETAFYISGTSNLVGAGSIWDPTAIKSLESSYTLHLDAGVYELKISLDGTTDTWKGFSDLTEVAEGLTGWESNNAIGFTLAEEGDVVVTYSVVDEVVTFTVTGNFFTIESGFYLFGLNAHSLFELTAADKFAANEGVEGEYVLNATLASGDMIQVGQVENNAVMWWFGSIYVVDAAHAGEKTIYFRPDYNPDWAEEFGGYIYIEANNPTGIDNTAADAKAVKMIQNGMILIIKGDKTYNIMGQIVK